MQDGELLRNINALAEEEHELFARQSSKQATEADRARLGQIQVMLDQCWDLLRQRRAKRDVRTVESYQG